jgi:hypothetical protein
VKAIQALLFLAVLLCSGFVQAQNYTYVAWQAIPGTDTGWPDIARLNYAQRQAISEGLQRDILPGVLRALAIGEAATRTEIVPGGYRLRTDPSFVTRFAPEQEAHALLFAAAIGYVLRQDSVLIFAIDQRGDSLTVRVRLTETCLTPQTAQRFFERAAAVAQGLGGGYTAFGCEMLFINLRDGKGAPYSGMDDVRFATALQRATAGFSPTAVVAGEFRTRTVLFGSDWPGNGAGRLYVDRMRDVPLDAIVALDLLAFRFGDLLRAAVR